MELSSTEDRMMAARVILTQYERDRQRDGFTTASTALCIAIYADGL